MVRNVEKWPGREGTAWAERGQTIRPTVFGRGEARPNQRLIDSIQQGNPGGVRGVQEKTRKRSTGAARAWVKKCARGVGSEQTIEIDSKRQY
jgi:hypothetical protein